MPRLIAFILGGRNGLGVVKVGTPQSLAEQHLVPDVMVGTSVSALNGVVVALDPTGAADRLHRGGPGSPVRWWSPAGCLAHARTQRQVRTRLSSKTGLESVITDDSRADTTVDTLTPRFGPVTMDLPTATLFAIIQEKLVAAPQTGAAIPSIFSAVTVNGRELYDDRVVANVPVTPALEMGHRLSPLRFRPHSDADRRGI